jgi:hypothetical protein
MITRAAHRQSPLFCRFINKVELFLQGRILPWDLRMVLAGVTSRARRRGLLADPLPGSAADLAAPP